MAIKELIKPVIFCFLTMFLIGVLLITACGAPGGNARASDADSSDTTQAGKNDGQRPSNSVPVEVTSLIRGDISNYLLYSSTLETEQIVDVFPRLNGLVEAIYVEESDRVKKGQKLLQIESDTYVLDEKNARLEFEKQKTNFNRISALQNENLLSEEEFENARLVMEQARIAWERARLNLDYTTLRSPISGVIGERLVRLGDRVQTADKLFSVANLDEKIVKAYVPQNEFSRIFKNQKVLISSDIMPGKTFPGYVKRNSPIIDPQSGTFKVIIGVKDSGNQLRPGMFVNARLIIETHSDTRLIPKSALLYENERSYFYMVDSDSSVKVELKKGFEDAEKVELLNDLPTGTAIVVLGQSSLKQGTKVKITNRKSYHWQNPTQNDSGDISAISN